MLHSMILFFLLLKNVIVVFKSKKRYTGFHDFIFTSKQAILQSMLI